MELTEDITTELSNHTKIIRINHMLNEFKRNNEQTHNIKRLTEDKIRELLPHSIVEVYYNYERFDEDNITIKIELMEITQNEIKIIQQLADMYTITSEEEGIIIELFP